MKYSLNKDRKYLTWNNQRGIAHVISRNYFWFKGKYLTAIYRLEDACLKKDRPLLSWCYYMIGDVHDFNNCPKAAIRAYNKSFALDSTNAASLREMGNMYEIIGQYQKAASLLKKAVQIDPDDEYAISDYEDAVNFGGIPLYQNNDIIWQAREYLAQDKPKLVIKLLSKKRSTPARQGTACAYGVLDDTNAALEQWRKIANAKETFEMSYSDWFYMTDTVWNSAELWEIVAQCAKQNRFEYSVWQMSDSLWNKVIQFPSKRKRNSKADLRRCNKLGFLLAQYHIARINRDLKLASKLFKRYPKWLEIETLCKKLC